MAVRLDDAQRKIALLHARLPEVAKERPDDLTLEGGDLIQGPCVPDARKRFRTTDGKTVEFGELSLKMLGRWATAETDPSRLLSLPKLDWLVTHLFPGEFKRFPTPVSEDEMEVLAFGEAIGIPEWRGRYLIDRTFAEQLPTFSSLSSRRGDALKFVRDYGGVYYLYRLDSNEAINKAFGEKGDRQTKSPYWPAVLLRIGVSIRYPVPYAKTGRADDLFRVRCKLTTQIYTPTPTSDPRATPLIGKYDGYVARGMGGNLLQWLVEARESPLPEHGKKLGDQTEDVALIYTELPERELQPESIDPLTQRVLAPIYGGFGTMLSQGQADKYPPVSSPVLLLKPRGYCVTQATDGTECFALRDSSTQEPRSESKFMREASKVLEIKREALWDEYDHVAIHHLFFGDSAVNSQRR